VKIVSNISSVYKKVSLILLLAFYKVSFLFNLIFKKAIAVLGVYNLVNLSLIMFFIITAVISLNLYKRLR
jgi:antibiotic biosynthesis monooxygenase (ABM) superfamily enzyme